MFFLIHNKRRGCKMVVTYYWASQPPWNETFPYKNVFIKSDPILKDQKSQVSVLSLFKLTAGLIQKLVVLAVSAVCSILFCFSIVKSGFLDHEYNAVSSSLIHQWWECHTLEELTSQLIAFWSILITVLCWL